jgi:hypothetical protein
MEEMVKSGDCRTTTLAQHIMQSFSPGEATPEQAHEAGKKFADEYLGGQYLFVLSTHCDKDHIHNHIIFCNVNSVTKKSFETEHNRHQNAWREMCKVSDKICREMGLSVIENKSRTGKSYVKYKNIPRRVSHRKRLMSEIDNAIFSCKNFDDFLEKMRANGTICTYNPEHEITLKFKPQGAKKNIRARGLGFDYDEKGIRRRIDDMQLFRTGESEKLHKSALIDTSTERMQKTPHLQRWADIRNMQTVSKQLNILTAKREITGEKGELAAENLAAVNREISEVSGLIYNLETWNKYKSVVDKWRGLDSNPLKKAAVVEFAETNKKAIQAWGKADYFLLNIDSDYKENGKFPPIGALKQRLKQLKSEKAVLYAEYKTVRDELLEVDKARKSVEEYLRRNQEPTTPAKTSPPRSAERDSDILRGI